MASQEMCGELNRSSPIEPEPDRAPIEPEPDRAPIEPDRARSSPDRARSSPSPIEPRSSPIEPRSSPDRAPIEPEPDRARSRSSPDRARSSPIEPDRAPIERSSPDRAPIEPRSSPGLFEDPQIHGFLTFLIGLAKTSECVLTAVQMTALVSPKSGRGRYFCPEVTHVYSSRVKINNNKTQRVFGEEHMPR
ncbi:DNA-directed RNA polymerase II subunit RPB1 [Dissostichus eleginoides]|uniref:DNA-directed RNA polymerase II subunit RPB1 n=1 Tax=Dissostichus eleginoides TaxID=100907 RepID=A0AAD9BWD5_DISEL|nr:DNA-directed RNA polymerase II subunit RPB1 [Dissostichus eleginoides]